MQRLTVGRSCDEPMWTLQQALDLHNALLPVVRDVGFCVALTGGVLREGSSRHDVDIIFYPLQSPAGDIGLLQEALRGFGMRLCADRAAVTARWRSRGSWDEKWVEVWELDGKRIDVFYLR